MEEDVLDEWMLFDPDEEARMQADELITKYGRNRRDRTDVVYDDKLSDLQFARTVEAGEAPSIGKRSARQRTKEKKMREVWRRVATYKNDDGRVLGQKFMRLPIRTREPEYFEKIQKPMSLNKLSSLTYTKTNGNNKR